MSNVLDKSFIHRSYPKLAYGSMYYITIHALHYKSCNTAIIIKVFILKILVNETTTTTTPCNVQNYYSGCI